MQPRYVTQCCVDEIMHNCHYLYSWPILFHHRWTTLLIAFTARMIVLKVDYAVEFKAKLRSYKQS